MRFTNHWCFQDHSTWYVHILLQLVFPISYLFFWFIRWFWDQEIILHGHIECCLQWLQLEGNSRIDPWTYSRWIDDHTSWDIHHRSHMHSWLAYFHGFLLLEWFFQDRDTLRLWDIQWFLLNYSLYLHSLLEIYSFREWCLLQSWIVQWDHRISHVDHHIHWLEHWLVKH